MANKDVATGLNNTLANAIVTYQKLHHYHWEVAGETFFDLHTKFEELYDKYKLIVDDVAERILTVGGKPLATLSEAIELATVKEDPKTPSAREMASRVLEDFMTQVSQMRSVIKIAEETGDRGTTNLLDGISDGLEKDAWMLRAYLAD